MNQAPPPTERRDHRCNRTDREAVARAARIYSSNVDAGQALGIAPDSFGRLCRRFGIETPPARRRREQQEARRR